MKTLSLKSRGDTIVEALIAMAILGMVIAGGFSISSHSIRTVRSAQERAEALKYVETQAELLRAAAAAKNANWTAINGVASGTPFCLNASGAVIMSACNPGGSFYSITITKNTAGDTFTIVNRWDNATGSGKDTVNLVYRVRSS